VSQPGNDKSVASMLSALGADYLSSNLSSPILLLRLFFCAKVLLFFFCYTERRSGLSGSYARFVS